MNKMHDRYLGIVVSLVACAVFLPALAEVRWPAEPFSQATNLTGIEGGGVANLGKNAARGRIFDSQ